MMLVRSVSTIEKSMMERNSEELDAGEGELINCIATTKRAHGANSMEACDVSELVAMFQGSVRRDYNNAGKINFLENVKKCRAKIEIVKIVFKDI